MVLLRMLRKDERRFICMTLKKEEACLHSLSLSHLKLQPSILALPLPKENTNVDFQYRVKLDHYLAFYYFTHICMLSRMTN